MTVKYSRFRHNAKQTSFTSPTGPRRQGGEHEHAQYPTNDDVTSGWSCRRPENVSILSSLIDHRGRQNVVKTTVTHSPAARVPLLCFYDILTSSVIYYWTDARQHGIYLLTRTYPTPDFKGRFWNQKVHPHHPWSSRRGSQSTVFTMPAIFACT